MSLWGNTLGVLFIGETARIRSMDTELEAVSAFVGDGTAVFSSVGDDGSAVDALTGSNLPSITGDSTGAVYFADSDMFKVRKVDSDGIITSYAGNGQSGDVADTGPATSLPMQAASYLYMDTTGVLYIADYNCIKTVSSAGILSILSSSFNGIEALYGDSSGFLYLADNFKRLKVTPDGATVTTIAGTGVSGAATANVPGTSSKLRAAASIFVDSGGVVYFTDYSVAGYFMLTDIMPTESPNTAPLTDAPSIAATSTPTAVPSATPTAVPSAAPTMIPTTPLLL